MLAKHKKPWVFQKMKRLHLWSFHFSKFLVLLFSHGTCHVSRGKKLSTFTVWCPWPWALMELGWFLCCVMPLATCTNGMGLVLPPLHTGPYSGNGCVTKQKVILIVWTQWVLRFRFFVWLFSIAGNFLHACGGNYSVAAARNAWVGNLVCLCVMENRSCIELWMVVGATALKKGLHNWRWKVR